MERLISVLRLFIVIGVVFLTGCATHIQPNQIRKLGTEHILNKNYTVGKKQEVFVGEPLLSVKDYFVTSFSSDVVSPNSSFHFDGALDHFSGKEGDIYKIVGNKVVDGRNYKVVWLNSPVSRYAHILVDDNGVAHNSLLVKMASPNQGFISVFHDYVMTPNSVRFVFETKKKVSQSKGFINYELIYNGRDKDSFHIAYREFSSDNLARPSFFQTLTYSTASNSIRFKQNLIQVHSVDNEKIVYTVKQD